MKRAAFLLALILLPTAVFAQDRSFDLTGAVVWIDPTSEGTFDSSDPTDIEFDGSTGFGVAANIFWTNRISTELAISRSSAETQLRRRAVGSTGGDVELTPVSAVLQFHLAPNATFDPYIGGGVAYVLFGDVDDVDNNISRIDFEDDYGFVINGGVGIRIGSRLGLTLDAKYVPLESAARAVFVTGPDVESDIEISPVILSAGVTLRF
jgi:outer membrane protein